MHGSRPLPQAPLCDLLPPAYLASLKRTDARVRFADDHPSQHPIPSSSPHTPAESPLSPTGSALELEDDHSDPSFPRPGLRRRWTGPPSDEERKVANSTEEWELSHLREKAEEAVARLAEAVAGAGGVMDEELRQQLEQMNIPETPLGGVQGSSAWASGVDGPARADSYRGAGPRDETGKEHREGRDAGKGAREGEKRRRSNLASPVPPNLPLTMLKLMEAYIVGLADVPVDQGGWAEAKRERALGVVKSLGASLGQAERLASSMCPIRHPHIAHISGVSQTERRFGGSRWRRCGRCEHQVAASQS